MKQIHPTWGAACPIASEPLSYVLAPEDQNVRGLWLRWADLVLLKQTGRSVTTNWSFRTELVRGGLSRPIIIVFITVYLTPWYKYGHKMCPTELQLFLIHLSVMFLTSLIILLSRTTFRPMCCSNFGYLGSFPSVNSDIINSNFSIFAGRWTPTNNNNRKWTQTLCLAYGGCTYLLLM